MTMAAVSLSPASTVALSTMDTSYFEDHVKLPQNCNDEPENDTEEPHQQKPLSLEPPQELRLRVDGKSDPWYAQKGLERVQRQLQDLRQWETNRGPVAGHTCSSLHLSDIVVTDPETTDDDDDTDADACRNLLRDIWNRASQQHVTVEQLVWFDCQGDLLHDLLYPIWRHDLVQSLTMYRVPLDILPPMEAETMNFEPSRRLQELRCEQCEVAPPEATVLQQAILSNTPNLKRLFFKSCLFLDNSVTLVAQGLRDSASSLVYLNLHWCSLHDDDIAALITNGFLASSCCALQEIDLAGNLCRRRGMEALARLLTRPGNQLANLRLREQCVEEGECLDIRPLARAMTKKSARSLRCLDVAVNRLDNQQLTTLVEAASMHGVLQSLDVRSNEIDDRGIQQMLHHHSAGTSGQFLKQIMLQDNPGITNMGATLLQQEASAMNSTLERIGLSEAYDGAGDLEYYTALNWGGRRLLSSEDPSSDAAEQEDSPSPLPLAVWPLVLERTNKYDMGMDCSANVLYFLLLNGPVLKGWH